MEDFKQDKKNDADDAVDGEGFLHQTLICHICQTFRKGLAYSLTTQ